MFSLTFGHNLSRYEGEIGFFDFYIIPLAKKLETCGVFGVSSHEYLGYARNNREEWVAKGKDLVEVYLERFKLKQAMHKDQQEAAAGSTHDQNGGTIRRFSLTGANDSTVGFTIDDSTGTVLFDC